MPQNQQGMMANMNDAQKGCMQAMMKLHGPLMTGNAVMRASTVRMLAPLLQFSTFAWFLGGLALGAAAL